MNNKHGRHTPAFLLLFLAEGPSYGAMLFTRMKQELPHCFADSAIIYRSLQDIEKQGLAATSWEIVEGSQPRKWYSITHQGMVALADFEVDIKYRRANFDFFLSRYNDVLKQDKTNSEE